MMNIRETGTVLHLFPYGNHGAVICWCTAQHGILRTASRNALKPGAGISGVVDLFHECELVYRVPSRGDLCSLVSADLINPRLPLRGDIVRLRMAAYMTNLLLHTVEPGEEDPRWHDLLSKALDYTATAAPSIRIILRFEDRLAELHGLASPQIPSHRALQQHFSHFPTGRDKLLACLNDRMGVQTTAQGMRQGSPRSGGAEGEQCR